jgi:uncharacterized membrane protein YeaQ/YmgE (transglycosylase-associated protein family)
LLIQRAGRVPLQEHSDASEPGAGGGNPQREERLEEMGIISWIIVGLIAGALGKLVMPGDEPGGFIVTLLIGMAGAVVGGFVVGILGGTGATGLNIWSILVATLGAIILLALYRLIAERSRVT